MGRRKKKDIDENKLNYRDFIEDLDYLVNGYWKEIKRISSYKNFSPIPERKLLLYFPFIPKKYKNPEIYIILKTEGNFMYLMSKLSISASVQIYVIHISNVKNKQNEVYSETFPIEFEITGPQIGGASEKTFKSPLVAIECPNSMKEEFFFKKYLLKDTNLNRYINSDLNYF